MKKNLFQKDLLYCMLRIRLTEEKIVEVYQEKTMRTPTHLSIGQEAVAAGVCKALKNDDQVFSPHRCHAHFLAKGGSIDAFFAELCGRETGINGGRIGSAHLSDEAIGIFSSPILGSMIPVAVGAALSFQMDRQKRIAVAFFGDAAIEEGIFAESINFAIVKKLPVLFICENNLYSTHSPLKIRQPSSLIYKRVSIPELKAQKIDGNDAEAVYRAALKAANHCRLGRGPAFIECLTYRIREHVGPLMDYDKGYRTKKEVDSWLKKCPVLRMKKKLLAKNLATQKEIDRIIFEVRTEIDAAYTKALRSPWPQTQTLLNFVY